MLWQQTEDKELQLEWKFLQTIAIFLPISNVFIPFLAALLALLVLLRHGWKAIATPLSNCLLWLSLWMIFTTIVAFDLGTAAGGLANFLPYFLLAAVTSYIIRTPAKFIHFLWLLVISSLLVSGFGILQAIINRHDWVFPKMIFDSYPIPMGFSHDHRIQSMFGHFNEAATYLMMLIPIALHFAIGKVKSISKYQRWVSLIAIALAICVIIFTGSRNVGGVLVFGFAVLLLYYRQWKLMAGFGLVILIIGWAVFGQKFGLGGEALRSLLPTVFVNRLASSIDPQLGDYASTNNRFNAWKFAISLISQHPIQGWGLRTFPLVANSVGYDLYRLPHEHNLFLAIAVGSGIPALLSFVGIIIWTIWTSLKSTLVKETEGTIAIVAISIILCLLSGCIDLVFYEPRISILLWCLLGSMYGLAEASKKAELAVQR